MTCGGELSAGDREGPFFTGANGTTIVNDRQVKWISVRSSGLEQVERSTLNGESGQTGFCPAGGGLLRRPVRH
jgi:hypothetical protein